MFARIFALLPLALLVSASHPEARGSGNCNTGSINCCNSVQTQSQASGLLTELGLVQVAAIAGGLIGVTCSGPTAIGTNSGCSATQQPTCCTGNNYSGAVVVGCSPTTING